jgi:hypothetical protein
MRNVRPKPRPDHSRIVDNVGGSQGYVGISVQYGTINDSVNGPGTPEVVTEWELNSSEVLRLLFGGRLRLSILGQVQPPLILEVLNPDET